MESRIDAVLVATDGSDTARRAAGHGIALAAALEADLHVLSVIDDPAGPLARNLLAEDVPQTLRSQAEADVEAVADLASSLAPGLSVTTAVDVGRPHEAIEEYAADGIDLVVVGTEGRSGVDRVLLGSVAENLLRTATRPVLVVPPGAPEVAPGGADGDAANGDATDADAVNALEADSPYRRLLVATDGSEGAERAAEWAVGVAASLDASVDALFAADATPFPTTVRSRELLEALEAAGSDAITSVRERGEAAGVPVSGAVSAGPPGPTILEFCDDESPDLVVMGTHGRSGLQRLLLGSVTEHVVRHGDVPVACVPPSIGA